MTTTTQPTDLEREIDLAMAVLLNADRAALINVLSDMTARVVAHYFEDVPYDNYNAMVWKTCAALVLEAQADLNKEMVTQ